MKFINKRNILIASVVATVVAVCLALPGLSAHPVASPHPTIAKITVSPSPTEEITAPVRLEIPTLDIDAPIISIGLTNDGSLDAPETLYEVGVYSDNPWPGQPGTAILDGHSGSPTQGGVLKHIDKLQIGDTISIVEVSGKTIQFKVTSSQAYPAVDATARVLFTSTNIPSMNLISCYGNWDEQTQEFDQRWIVKAIKE